MLHNDRVERFREKTFYYNGNIAQTCVENENCKISLLEKIRRCKFKPWSPAASKPKEGTCFYQYRYDSLKRLDAHEMVEQDELLKQAQWYQAGVPREIALEVLAQQEIGSFIVRDSTTHPNCYALSVKVPKFENPTGISHYLIHRTQRGGFKLKGLEKEWPSLTALVTHHTVMPEMLPCTLRMPRNSNNPAFKDKEDKDEREEDEDYQKLADFSSMMNDLKM